MNERLKELMIEAGYAAPEIAGRANKLAELIVRECDRFVAEWYDPSEPWMRPGDLLKHFGVESEINQQLRNRSTYFGNNP